MCRKSSLLMSCLLIACLLWITPALAKDPPKGVGQPILLVDGAWNPRVGAWSVYRITNLKDNTESIMYFASLQHTTFENRPARWLEIEVTTHDKNRALTRILAEEKPDGLGEVLKVIVQPKGYDPFIVPQSMLDAADGPKNDMHRIAPGPKLKKKHFKYKGKRFSGWQVNAKDAKGRPVSVVVSEYVAPLGLVKANTSETKLKLLRFGDGAKSRITGEPVNFYLWITQQVVKGLSSE